MGEVLPPPSSFWGLLCSWAGDHVPRSLLQSSRGFSGSVSLHGGGQWRPVRARLLQCELSQRLLQRPFSAEGPVLRSQVDGLWDTCRPSVCLTSPSTQPRLPWRKSSAHHTARSRASFWTLVTKQATCLLSCGAAGRSPDLCGRTRPPMRAGGGSGEGTCAGPLCGQGGLA